MLKVAPCTVGRTVSSPNFFRLVGLLLFRIIMVALRAPLLNIMIFSLVNYDTKSNHNNENDNNFPLVTWQLASFHHTCLPFCEFPTFTILSSIRRKGTGTVSMT